MFVDGRNCDLKLKFIGSILVMLFAVGPILAFAAGEPENFTVLLTSFDHWQDPVNSGVVVGTALEKSSLLAQENITVVHCKNLSSDDTTGSNAFTQTQNCLRKLKKNPDLVISLGEGQCNKIKLETRFANTIRSGAPLDSEEGPVLPSTVPLGRMYCAGRQIQESRKTASKSSVLQLQPSENAGFVACNNSAFYIAKALRKLALPFGFVHVPRFSKSCHLNEASKSETVAAVEAMLVAASREIRSRKKLGTGAEEIQPKNQSEVVDALEKHRSESEKNCQKDFYAELLKQYSATQAAPAVDRTERRVGH